MLVFGDPSRDVGLGHMVRKLVESVAGLQASAPASGLEQADALREILITAGELEQGIADAAEGLLGSGAELALEAAMAATDASASTFVARQDASGSGAGEWNVPLALRI